MALGSDEFGDVLLASLRDAYGNSIAMGTRRSAPAKGELRRTGPVDDGRSREPGPQGSLECQRREQVADLLQFFHQVLELEGYEKEALQPAGNISPVVAKRLTSTLHLEEHTELMDRESAPPFL